MGLIAVSDPLLYTPETDEPVPVMNVVVGSSDTEVVKVFYTSSDSREGINQLLDNGNVDEVLKNAILKAIGYKVNATSSSDLSTMSKSLPGVDLMVKHPVSGEVDKLWSIAINLNDQYKWKRESVADWIESVAETKDISFPVPEVKNEVGKVSSFTKVVKIQRILSR
jgi:hypothetical protein